jgi:hypothetical protein
MSMSAGCSIAYASPALRRSLGLRLEEVHHGGLRCSGRGELEVARDDRDDTATVTPMA